jgi:hypothetical protein
MYNRPLDIGDHERDGIEYILDSAGTVSRVASYLQNVNETPTASQPKN